MTPTRRFFRGSGHLSRRVLVLLVLALPLGCGGISKRLEVPRTPQRSFVFGFIDMREAPTGLEWVTLRQVSPPTDRPYFGMRVHDGVFYSEVLEPGAYALDGFGHDGNFFVSPHIYNAGRQASPIRLEIDQPGVYFVGSFRYMPIRTGIFEPDKYDIVPAEDITEQSVLARIREFVEGTEWEPALRERFRSP